MITIRKGASTFPPYRREIGFEVQRHRWPDKAWGIDVALWRWAAWIEVAR